MKRYKHNKSNYKLLTAQLGRLYPVTAFETIPGDTVQIQNSALIRVTPLQTPVMHPVVVRFHSYFVPTRILDPEDGSFKWEDFITGGEDGLYTTPPPTHTGTVAEGHIMDYFGLKPGSRTYNAFLPAAMAKIFNEYYRDQQLQAELDVDTFDGLQDPLQVSWAKDYFTAARPEPQLGPEVTLSLGTQAPVRGLGTGDTFPSTNITVEESDGTSTTYANARDTSVASGTFIEGDGAGPGASPQVFADLSAAGALNINDMRRAFALQRYQEARNLYGARFTEYLRYLGIRSSDARLQRPEYIGGGKGLISFSEVLSTDSGGTDPVGTLKGHGIAAVGTRRSRYFCEEHGHVITLMSTRPKSIYPESQHKMFNRTTKEEYWQKELQQIGQEEIYNREISADHPTPGGVFGWGNRYQSFASVPSTVAGEFRSTLNSWHYGREYADPDIALNESFIQCNPTNRVYSDTSDTTDKLWCMVNNKVVVRSMLRKNPSSRIL